MLDHNSVITDKEISIIKRLKIYHSNFFSTTPRSPLRGNSGTGIGGTRPFLPFFCAQITNYRILTRV